MPSESDLRKFFADADPGDSNTGLDTKRVIARSRARRLPKQIAAAAVGTLVVVGFGAVGLQSLQVAAPISSMDQTLEAPADGMESAAKRLPAEMINLCGSPLADTEPSFYGLQLEPVFPATAPVGTEPVAGLVRVTNTSDIPVTGSLNPVAAITLSQDEITVWHSNGPMIVSLLVIDLAPGESVEFAATFTPVWCATGDDLGEAFPETLPPVPTGDYELSALIYFIPDASMPQTGTTELDLVSGPRTVITLQ